ncbi:ArsR family transcriptional regulator [Curtobacterium sp. MCBD17_034]|uniref:ArsR/SmtB family transcription factor n=1 Tax=unclassified Curtobacterium TaxID=257496 RepID=UPI000DAAC15F|nr:MULTISPECIES: metalloregulator ArsR/SmtB family transcription factor [unclassified Curtobacterium]PZE74296.1 ArsR family transcriptional regulator [Curtobacterium sp. MCBD17_019]PZF58639.1 ArsR family transcriptional regulator [Curtobacterium sp. MCBD17_034]PZF64312.1 ArsR family transcriptional regulator [Curtobacterium sp. MCBD17_013]PZM34629.1 ArsR family transcriptional regulator [Curtobacterium sp. MCBD17_031]
MPDIFGVIADPTRRRLLATLLEEYGAAGSVGELSVGALVTRLGISQPTVSKHLRVLRDAGLVRTRDEGQHRYYRLDPEPLVGVEEWLAPFTGVVAAEEVPATTAWTPDGRPVSVRRGAAGRSRVDVGTELGRVMAEASFRATTAISGAQTGWERVVDPVRRRLQRRAGEDDD